MAQPLPAPTQPPTQNYQFAYGNFSPTPSLDANANAVSGVGTGGATVGGSTAPGQLMNGVSGVRTAGGLGGGLPAAPFAGAGSGTAGTSPDANPNNLSYAPTVGGGAVPGGTPGGAPTFSAVNPLGENAMMGPGADGAYGETAPGPTRIAGKTPIVRKDAYEIGPYYGYAFDAGGRVLESGYDAAGQLAAAGSQAAALGVGAGQQVGATANAYADQMAAQGYKTVQSTQNYERELGQYGDLSQQGAVAAQSIGAGAQQAAQQAGTAMGAQGGQFIKQGAAAGQQDIAGVDLTASREALARSSSLANQLSGIGAQQGPSAAQAQLQSALNQSNAQNLAMARSGRGWGGSASAQSQALAANAAAGQQAANASATLRAQEEQQRLAMLSSNVGQAAQLQQAGAQTALGQQQARATVNLQEAQQQAQQQQALYGLGLQAQQQGAELGLQGAGVALQGNQAYQAGIGQAGQLAGQAGQLDLAGRQAYLQALQQGGALATQGQQAGAELGLQGIGQGAGLYAQGQQMSQSAELQAMQFAAQQQQANAALQNAALQQYGIQKGVAIQQQQMTNQLIGAGIQTAGTLAAGAAMMSDRSTKTDVKPASVDLRPMSNYQLLGTAAGDAGVTNAGVSSGAMLGGTDLGQDAKTKQGLSAMAGGVSDFGAAMAQPQGLNPVFTQSLQGVGAGSVISDRRAKEDIQKLDAAGSDAVRAIQGAGKSGQLAALDNVQRDQIGAIRNANGMSPTSAFDAAQAYSYQYKQPEKYGEGEFIGLMAQDLAKSPAGSTAVVPQANGKLAVDMNRLGMLTAAAQSQTQEQVSTLEDKLARLQRRVLSQQSYSDGTY